MATTEVQWSVLPHGELEAHADNLWSIRGEIPRIPLGRRMVIARRPPGELLVHNPMTLREGVLEAVCALGTIATIYVPGPVHRMDCEAFKARFPGARLLCPPGAVAAVGKAVEVEGTVEDFEARDGVSLEVLDGVGETEGVLRVESADGVSLVFNDALFNLPHQPGVAGLLFRLLGSSGGPRVTWLGRRLVVKDAAALGAHLERFAREETRLRRIIPGHGDVIEEDPQGVLRAVAATLR